MTASRSLVVVPEYERCRVIVGEVLIRLATVERVPDPANNLAKRLPSLKRNKGEEIIQVKENA